MPAEKHRLPVVAAKLARHVPGLWQEFLMELRNHSDSIKDDLVRAPVTDVLVAQGRAKHSAELVSLLSDAVKTADRIEQAERQRETR